MSEKKKIGELPACPVETTLMLIGDKWKVLILRDLMPGTKRFGELKKSIGSVSQKVLTAQLRDMEEKGLVNRKVYAEVPPRVEYSLTDLGRSLKPILAAMWDGGEGYKAQISGFKKGKGPEQSWKLCSGPLCLFRGWAAPAKSAPPSNSPAIRWAQSGRPPPGIAAGAAERSAPAPPGCWRAPAGGRCP